MAFSYREDLVGKRFLSVSGNAKVNVNKISEWEWKAGVIRAASLKDNQNKELQVLIEYDGIDWQRREWVPVHSRKSFKMFFVEKNLVWAPFRLNNVDVRLPALTFKQLAPSTVLQVDALPVEYLHNRTLQFHNYTHLQLYHDWDPKLASIGGIDTSAVAAIAAAAADWRKSQDGQRILTTTPTVLGGCRAQVYRVAGATQWYTAVIVGVSEHTGELTVTDDTVLEERSEDPSLVQMKLLGHGVIEAIMRGGAVVAMPRRSRSNLQGIESGKSSGVTGGRKKSSARNSSHHNNPPVEPAEPVAGPSTERETDEIKKEGVIESASTSGNVVEISVEIKCTKEEVKSEECSVSGGKVKGAVRAGADGVVGAVASEEDDCVIVCARDADDRSDSGVSGVRSGGSANSVEEWRGMAHGYGGGPPPPLLHLPPPPPPTLYANELLWKQRYQPPMHAPLHHAIADEYLAATTYDRERQERLLRDREQRDILEKQQKEKERERMDREKLEREEKERREQDNAASKLVSRHFEESLRLANQKRTMSWSLLNSLPPNRGSVGPEHDRLRQTERAYYSPPAHPSDRLPQQDVTYVTHSGHSQHAHSQLAARHSLAKQDKPQPHPGLPKGEPNFSPYNYPYRYEKLKDQHLPAPPPLVPEKSSVIVKHEAKQIHLEQKHPYPSKPRSEPSPHYLPSRPYRTGLSPHAPPHPHPVLQTSPHAALPPPQDKNRRIYQAPPQRSPASYYQTAPTKPKVSSPAPPHIYGKPTSNPLSPAHFTVAVEPLLHLSKVEPPPIPYPPPSAFSPAPRTRPPPIAHSRTPEPRVPIRAHGEVIQNLLPCQTQPLDLGISRDDPDRLTPRKRYPFESMENESKRHRLDSPAPEPLIATAASVVRTPLGSEPAPPAPGPPCDVRVPSADGRIETPEKAAGSSPAHRLTPAPSPAPSTPVPPMIGSPPITLAPPSHFAPPVYLAPHVPLGPPAPVRPPVSLAPPVPLGPPLPLGPPAPPAPIVTLAPPVPVAKPVTFTAPVITGPQIVTSPPAPPATPPVVNDISAKVTTPNPKVKSGPVRHLGKKAWLQRHETASIGDGDCSSGVGVCTTLPKMISGTNVPDESHIVVPVAAKSMQRGTRKPSKPKKAKVVNDRTDDAEEDTSSSDRELNSLLKRKLPKAKRKKVAAKKSNDEPKEKKVSESGSESDRESDGKGSESGGSGSGCGSTSSKRPGNSSSGNGNGNNNGNGNGKPRGNRRSRGGGGRGGKRKEDPPKKAPSGARSKPSAESFLQNGPCFEVAPRLSKCRECQWSPSQRDKNLPNMMFCRFYSFRRLKYTKNRQLSIAGFSDPYKDAEEADKKLWLSLDVDSEELDIEMSCFLLREIGDQFCELLQQEKEAENYHLNEDKTVAWKRVVQGTREICDVCEITLFNFHWTCGKCGFVVCYDCYKSRTSDELANIVPETPAGTYYVNGERDSFGWLVCTTGSSHPARRLLLTQIAPGGVLESIGERAHRVRSCYCLQTCACGVSPTVPAISRNTGRILLQEALKKNQKKEDVEQELTPTNGSPVKQETVKHTSSIVSWLTDVTVKTEVKDEKADTSSSDSEAGNFSTLRDLLIRSASDSGSDVVSKKKPKREKSDSLDEVISSVVVEKKEDDESEEKPFVLSDVVKRYDRIGRGREQLPMRIMTLTESKLLYPDVPHGWLCDGKLLHLTDPTHIGNYKLFQDQWKRGQPVLISDMLTVLNKDLWSPESFSRDFGDTRVDLVNCTSGLVVPNQPARKFWDGFELAAKRLRDERGAPMVLKLKDWPPGEDFEKILPSRFSDLDRVLPLREYTCHWGKLNLAARLPECFVPPDLGPKMYTAYGGAGGTTNLHLDVSDAVNVLVHASAPADAPERAREAARAAEDAGVDILSRQRARVKPPAALWHVYDAKDADKIRDLLVKAEIERGGRPKAQNDPVHDQTWYLDAALRDRLYREYGVEGYAILQCPGDAVFIPAGAPHQVRNLLDCIKVAEDFVSPENVSRCFELAQQFRKLSRQHANKEDKLQIKNIVYHAMKDSVCSLERALARVK